MTDYTLLQEQLASMILTERDTIANLANASALLYMSLSGINWAGFYLTREGQLVLGPFQGKPACVRIPWGKGVCGTAAKEKAPQLVPDVYAFPGHIACDGASRSELVIPLLSRDGAVIGVLDLDSPVPGRFTEEDLKGLGPVVQLFCASLEIAGL